ncbi:MAG: hypothetical protein U0792_17210 [Gemmataceae bacterium]
MLRALLVCLVICFSSLLGITQPAAKPVGLKFQVKLAANQVGKVPESGRVLVGIGPADGEPDFTNYRPPVLPILGADADKFTADQTITLDVNSDVFPIDGLAKLPAGEYTVQAIFATHMDINLPHAPGNRYCTPIKVKLDPSAGTTITLTLDKASASSMRRQGNRDARVPPHTVEAAFGLPRPRPMEYRVGRAAAELREGTRQEIRPDHVVLGWLAVRDTRTPSAIGQTRDSFGCSQMVPGPFGDPYVDSANNGPYGAAFTQG